MSEDMRVKEMLFTKMIIPLVTSDIPENRYTYFMDKAYTGRTYQISQSDLDKVKQAEEICAELYKLYGDDFILLCSEMYTKMHTVYEFLENSQDQLGEAKNDRQKAIRLADDYTKYSENGFRLFSSFLFYYLCKADVNMPARELYTYVEAASGTKLSSLNKEHIINGKTVNLSGFTEGFDGKVRNVLGGHNRYVVDDDYNYVVLDVDSKTGKEKPEGIQMITKKELEEQLAKAKKTIWILDLALELFFVNTPEARSKINKIMASKTPSLPEIEALAKRMSMERQLEITKFDYHKKKNVLQMVLKHKPPMLGTGGEVFLSTGERASFQTIEEEVEYDKQVLGVICATAGFFERDAIPNISMSVFSEDDVLLAESYFDCSEIKKTLELADPSYMPNFYGTLPVGTYTLKY